MIGKKIGTVSSMICKALHEAAKEEQDQVDERQ